MSEQAPTKDLFHCCECDRMLPLCDFRVYKGTRKGYCMRCEPKYAQRRRGAKIEARDSTTARFTKATGASPLSAWPLSRKAQAARKRKQQVAP
jgi:hypothetical protein